MNVHAHENLMRMKDLDEWTLMASSFQAKDQAIVEKGLVKHSKNGPAGVNVSGAAKSRLRHT